MARLLSLAAVACAFFAACGSVSRPPPLPLDEAGLAAAVADVERAAAEEPGIALAEDGLLLDAYTWTWRDRVEVPPTTQVWRLDAGLGPEPLRIVRERALVGPSRTYIGFGRIAEVAVRRFAIGSGVELALDDREEPIFVETRDDAGAVRLAAALERLRRARSGDDAEPAAGAPAPPGVSP